MLTSCVRSRKLDVFELLDVYFASILVETALLVRIQLTSSAVLLMSIQTTVDVSLVASNNACMVNETTEVVGPISLRLS